MTPVLFIIETMDMIFFGFKTLEKSYLLKLSGKIAERPQHMLMRVSVGIHLDDIDSVIETYDLMSKRFFTHATPTLFNAGTPKPQMSSCFLWRAAQARSIPLTQSPNSTIFTRPNLNERALWNQETNFLWVVRMEPVKLENPDWI